MHYKFNARLKMLNVVLQMHPPPPVGNPAIFAISDDLFPNWDNGLGTPMPRLGRWCSSPPRPATVLLAVNLTAHY